MSLRSKPIPGRSSDLDYEAFRELVECNLRKGTRKHTVIHLKKIVKVERLGSSCSKNNKEDRVSIATSLLSKQTISQIYYYGWRKMDLWGQCSTQNAVWLNPCNLPQSRNSMEVKLCWIGLMSRVIANGPGNRGSIPGRVIPKTQKNGIWCRLA